MPLREQGRPLRLGARSQPGSRPFGLRARLEALGNQSAVGAPGLDRRSGRLRPPPALALTRSTRRSRPRRRIASSASSGSCSRTHLRAGRDRQRRRRRGRPLALAAGARSSQEPARTAPRKSLRESATNSGRPRLRSSPSRRRISRSSVDGEVEVEPRVEGDLLLGDAARERGLEPLGEPARQVGDRVVVLRAARSTRGGPSMCIST